MSAGEMNDQRAGRPRIQQAAYLPASSTAAALPPAESTIMLSHSIYGCVVKLH